MNDFINVWTSEAVVFLNTKEIARISFAKKEELRQSERVVKVQFKDGSHGEYVGHVSLQKAFEATSDVKASKE